MTSFIVLLLSLFLTTNIFSQFKQIYEKRIYKALMINSKCFLVCKPNDQIKRYIFFENMRSFCWRSLWVVIENKTLIANPKDERNHKYLTNPLTNWNHQLNVNNRIYLALQFKIISALCLYQDLGFSFLCQLFRFFLTYLYYFTYNVWFH